MNIFAYPEFIAAILIGALLFARIRATAGGVSVEGDEFEPGENGILTTAAALVDILPKRYTNWLRDCQMFAGQRSSGAFSELSLIKLGASMCMMVLCLLIPIVYVVPIAVVAFFIPDLCVLLLALKRKRELRDALPQALDLMVLCVDAGLGLDAALQRVMADAALVSSALNDELSILSRDILLGMDRTRAYAELYRRTGLDELKMVGSALNQSTRLGLSIARILRAQSEFLRSRQSQRAEEQAAKLPVWMAFPLWFFIMPALMLVILGPTFITFVMNLGGHSATNWIH